ncbi:hypothetical protein GW17_00058444 [Ensete ventricosum]|nr:hypothetical protein GW17_00058444 [Ensete ventricosum]
MAREHYRPLPGVTVNWGCYRPVTARNRSITVDFDRHRLLPYDISRGRIGRRDRRGRTWRSNAALPRRSQSVATLFRLDVVSSSSMATRW